MVALVGVFHQRDPSRSGLGERVQHGGQRGATVNRQATDQIKRRHGGRVAGVDLDLTSVIEQRGDEPLGQFGSRERAVAVVFRGLGSPPRITPSHGRDGVAACRNEVKSLAGVAHPIEKYDDMRRSSLFAPRTVADCRRDAGRELASEIGYVGIVDCVELPHIEVEIVAVIISPPAGEDHWYP